MGRGATLWLALMLVAAFLSGSACRGGTDELPDNRLGIRHAPLLLLSRRDVQQDLNLTRTQVDDAMEAIRTIHARAAALPRTQDDKVLQARRAIDADQAIWIEEHLSEAQRKRIVQIDLQWEGAAALVSRPVLSELLGLTTDQRTGLRLAVDESARRRAAGEDLFQVQKKLSQDALGLLTQRQKDRWMELLGRPYQPQLAGRAPAQRPAQPQ